MPPGGRNTSGNVVDGDGLRRRPSSRLFRRSKEKNNPGNLEIERQIAAFQARQEQQQQQQMSAFLDTCYRACLPYYNILSADVEDGENPVSWNDVFKFPGSSAPLLLVKDGTQQQGEEPLLENSANKPPPDTEFLEGTFIKLNSDKQKATRNKKNKKKKGKGRNKQSHASEIKSEPSHTKPSSTCAGASGDEALLLSSSHVALGLPLLEYSSSSISREILINPVTSGASSEKELFSSSNDDDLSFDRTTASSSFNDYCTGGNNVWNNTKASECINSRGFKKKIGGGNNNPNGQKSFSLAISPGDSQGGSLCNDGEFQKVISRKAARKMKNMQRLESPTMTASGPIVTHALLSRGPRREAITVAHYIKDDRLYGRKPNPKTKGKNQKGPNFSNVSKTGYTDDRECSSLGNLANGSCDDREVQKKDMAPNGGDTEDVTDSTAPSSDKTSSLGHLANASCVGIDEPKKSTAPVGGHSDTKDTLAPSSDKTSSLDHLDNFSCVEREEQKAMAPVGGDSDTKDTDSIGPSSDKTSSSLGHLSNSSCVKWEEQKKEDNEQAFSTHASSELDKIIKAANDAYTASDAYMIYGVHADIETFLHSATPVIAQISCTANNISLQHQCLWSVWRWYEEPECRGIEVEMQGSINSRWPNSSTYFVPSLSGIQLFGQSGNRFSTPEEPCLLSPNHGGLFFEYFESEMPFFRPPLFTKVKQLLNGVNLSGDQILGDPKHLKSVKLSDLHPASWFCVSWYPIYQIPSDSQSSRAAFLTYHSLGKYMADGLHRIICPVVGLLGYRDQGEKWFQLREQPRSRPTPKGSWKTHPAELLNKKMKALRHCASIMSKAVVPRASGDAMNYHPDYEFFWSRSQY